MANFETQWNRMIGLRNQFLKAVATLPSREPSWSTPYSRLAIGEQELRDYSRKYHHSETMGENQQKQRLQRLVKAGRESGETPQQILRQLQDVEGLSEGEASRLLVQTK